MEIGKQSAVVLRGSLFAFLSAGYLVVYSSPVLEAGRTHLCQAAMSLGRPVAGGGEK